MNGNNGDKRLSTAGLIARMVALPFVLALVALVLAVPVVLLFGSFGEAGVTYTKNGVDVPAFFAVLPILAFIAGILIDVAWAYYAFMNKIFGE
ncbi:MAG: hypothetical protein RLY93_02205 [Sumerlaeia bacterium]